MVVLLQLSRRWSIHQGLPGKASPNGGRSEGDCAPPVTVTQKEPTVYFWGLVTNVVQEEKLQAARWHNLPWISRENEGGTAARSPRTLLPKGLIAQARDRPHCT